MPAKVYIALALLVLFGALATGNPFLPRPARARLPADDGVRLLSLRTGHAAGHAAGLAAVALPCPVPELQAQVVEVRFDADGEPSWILRDGRVLRQDAVTATTTAAAGH
jgi:hypothetical protein